MDVEEKENIVSFDSSLFFALFRQYIVLWVFTQLANYFMRESFRSWVSPILWMELSELTIEVIFIYLLHLLVMINTFLNAFSNTSQAKPIGVLKRPYLLTRSYNLWLTPSQLLVVNMLLFYLMRKSPLPPLSQLLLSPTTKIRIRSIFWFVISIQNNLHMTVMCQTGKGTLSTSVF